MISIIIPTYREEKYIGRLLESVRKQKVKGKSGGIGIEVIVADRKSGDKTRKIAKKYGCKVVEGGSPSEGRNAGARKAGGELLIFLDADTVLPGKSFVENVIGEFSKSGYDVASCLFKPREGDSRLIFSSTVFNLTKKTNQKSAKYFGKVIGDLGCMLMVRKSLFNKIGGFDEELMMMEDSDFVQRAVSAGGKYGVLSERILVSGRRFKSGRRSLKSATKVAALSALLIGGGLMGVKYAKSRWLKAYEQEKGEMGGV